MGLHGPGRGGRRGRRALVRRLLRAHPLRAIAGLWLTLPTYTDERLATIADRTLVVTGDRDDLADLAQAERLFRAIAGASLAVIPDAGHGAADTPLFWQVVASFLT